MENPSAYLQPSDAVESGHPGVLALCGRLTENASDLHERARRLFAHVRDSLAYALANPFFLPEHYRASAILARGRGYCVQKAVVLAALGRAAGIPSRLHFADIRNHRVAERMRAVLGTNLFVYHCYVEMHLGGRWVAMTPAFDRRLCEEHGYPLVEFDGHQSAIFPTTDGQGRPFVEYLRHHGSFADVPLEPMLAAWVATYGRERVEGWKRIFLAGAAPASIR